MNLVESTEDLNKDLKNAYRLFPGFCVGDGMYNLAIENINKEIRGKASVDPWSWDINGANVTFVFCDAILYFLLTLAVDYIKSYPAIQAKMSTDPSVPRVAF